jgi:hypothetical protein
MFWGGVLSSFRGEVTPWDKFHSNPLKPFGAWLEQRRKTSNDEIQGSFTTFRMTSVQDDDMKRLGMT